MRLAAAAAWVLLVACGPSPPGLLAELPPLPELPGEAFCVPWDDAGRPFDRLSDTGCFPDGAAADLVPFAVRSPLFTEGVAKERWLSVPPGAAVGFSARGPWEFPEGSLLVKRFATPEGDPIEVRFLRRRALGWEPASYRWQDGRALRTLGGFGEDIPLPDGRVASYWFPDAEGCDACHRGGAIGPRTDQLHAVVRYGDVEANQLEALAELGVLAGLPASLSDLPALARPDDPTAPLEDRARAWLDGNCAHCHRPEGWAPPDLGLDLRASIPLSEAEACGVPVQGDTAPEAGALRIDPGAPENSAVWGRLGAEDATRMPPDGGRLLDPRAEETVRPWIEALVGCPSL